MLAPALVLMMSDSEQIDHARSSQRQFANFELGLESIYGHAIGDPKHFDARWYDARILVGLRLGLRLGLRVGPRSDSQSPLTS